MSVELLQTLSLVAFIIAGVLVAVAAMLFFLLDVPKLVGDITGANERKAIESIRQHNEEISDKENKSITAKTERRKITDKISPSGRLNHAERGDVFFGGTKKFSTTELAPTAAETTVLSNVTNETTILSSDTNETTVLSGDTNETTVLSAHTNETTVLSQTDDYIKEQPTIPANVVSFTVDVEMNFTGSTEVIE